MIKEDSQFLWIHCLNPDHDDANPSMCVNKVEHNGKPVGFFYCYVCGWHGNMDAKEVKKMSKKNTMARKKRPIDWKRLNMCYRMFVTNVSKPFDVSYDTLQQYGWGWDSEAHCFPMKNEEDEIIGIHRRFPTGEKCCVEGSTLGLFLPPCSSARMGVVEGVSDTCVASECGLSTIGLPSSSFGHEIAVKYLKKHGVKSVVLIGDKGEPGQKSVEKMKKLLDLEGKIEYNILQCKRFKDLREYHEKNGKSKTIKLLRLS